jgi:tRNA(Arg) A34 adenosine deaminase TadA
MYFDRYQYYNKIKDDIKLASEKHIILFKKSKRLLGQYNEYSNKQSMFVAAIYDKKFNLIGAGQNSYVKTHPIQKKFGVNNNIFLHAEIQALVNALRRTKSLKGTILTIYRINRQGYIDTSFCCDGCIDALTNYGIKSIVFFDSSKGICVHTLKDNKNDKHKR